MAEINQAIVDAIKDEIPDAEVEVSGAGGGHFALSVTSPSFEGKNTLARHRMVLGALKNLLAGDQAPVHAIDSIKTSVG